MRSLAKAALASPARLAALSAAAALALLLALSGSPGISRDEARVLSAAAAETGGEPTATRASDGRPAPPLAARVSRATAAILSRAGLSDVRAHRAPTALLGAALTALLVLLGHALAGAGGAALAPALFWLAPRHLHAGLVATPDLAAAALWLLTVAAWRRALRAAAGGAQLRASLVAGAAFGAALAVRADAWVLLVALAVHAGGLAIVSRRRRREDEGGLEGAASAPVRGAVAALAAMIVLGPLALVAVWEEPVARLAAALGRGTLTPGAGWDHLGAPLAGRFPASYPLLVTALTVPAAILWTYAAGVAHALARTVRPLRGDGGSALDDALLLAAAAAPFVAAAAGVAPLTSGVRPWLPAAPFLALLGARALVRAAELAWPSRRGTVLGALAILVLYPALRQTAHAFPAGASAWNELAGGAPGAASLGLQRQDGGEAAVAILGDLNARARGGARVWWPRTARAAVEAWTRDGTLRPDLVLADGAYDADIAVVTLDGATRDAEYRAWAALRTARPVSAAYLDDVPLVLVYARAGAWR